MNMFGWNQSKLARIAELEEQNRELQEIRESLLHEVGRIQGEFMVMRDVVDECRECSEQQRNIAERLEKERDDLVAENKSVHNIGIEYRESAERFSGQNDDLRRKLDDSLTKICKLHERIAVLENAIRTAVSIAGL